MIKRIIFTGFTIFTGLVALAQIPTNGLVAYYPFSGNANDATSNQNNGTVVGATLTTDRFGNKNSAYKFNGIDQYIQVPDNDMFSIITTGKLSISVWVKCDTLNFTNTEGDGYVHWMGKGETNNQEWTFRIYNNNNTSRPNRMSCYAFNLSGKLGSGSYVQEIIAAGMWMHFVAIYDYSSNKISWYKNGAVKSITYFTDYSVVPGNGNAPLRIGTRDFSSFFKGAIDDIRIYNRVLTQTEITSLYNEQGLLGAVPVTRDQKSTLKVYPDPVVDKITVDLGNDYSNSGNCKIKIINTLGQTVYTNILNQMKTELDLSSINNKGVYFVNITDATDKTVGVKKIMIQ